MPRPRVSFLPAFFTTLAILFAIAVVVRVRSYRDDAQRVDAPAEVAQTSADGTMRTARPANVATTAEPPAPATAETTTTIARRQRRAPIPFVPPPPAASSASVTQPQPPPVAPKPSLFSRIVNAITGKPAATPASNPIAQPPQMASSGGGHTSGTTTSGSRNTSTADPNDPNSDTQPPQLVAIFFTPQTIADGQETMLTVQATDNLSGVRSVSGTIAAPSGAVQGFACQRQADTDTYTARIAVPKDAAEGVWKVNYLSLIDNASNSATLSVAQNTLPPTATFRVTSSSSDTQGPTLKAVWLASPSLKAGEKDTVFIEAEDDKSGVNLVSGVFISPAKKARIGFVCRPGEGGTTWQGDLSTPATIDCGDWQLEQVQLQDKANNMTTVHADNPLVQNVRVTVSGASCDSTPPEVTSVSLDRNVVSNNQDSVVTATIIATDDSSGVMSMSGQVTGPTTGSGAPRLYFSCVSGGDGTTWIGRITVPKLAAKGTWRITWLQVLDQAHNIATYTPSDRPLANAIFTVQ